MIITKRALPRRTFLRGMGATVALPFLDAMVPALSAEAKRVPRFATVYIGNGANMSQWTPSTEGINFEMSPTLKGIEGFRERLAVFTGLDNFPATDQGDLGGQHPRSAPGFMSGFHAKATEGADVQAGTTIDQMIAAKICTDTRLPSLEVTVDRIDVVGACDHGYACAYMNCMSWRTPTTPLPSETNPRFVFERMFGVGSTGEERMTRAAEDRSLLDELTEKIADLHRRLGARGRLQVNRLRVDGVLRRPAERTFCGIGDDEVERLAHRALGSDREVLGEDAEREQHSAARDEQDHHDGGPSLNRDLIVDPRPQHPAQQYERAEPEQGAEEGHQSEWTGPGRQHHAPEVRREPAR